MTGPGTVRPVVAPYETPPGWAETDQARGWFERGEVVGSTCVGCGRTIVLAVPDPALASTGVLWLTGSPDEYLSGAARCSDGDGSLPHFPQPAAAAVEAAADEKIRRRRPRVQTEQIVVRVSESLYEALRADAAEHGRTVSQSARHYLTISFPSTSTFDDTRSV